MDFSKHDKIKLSHLDPTDIVNICLVSPGLLSVDRPHLVMKHNPKWMCLFSPEWTVTHYPVEMLKHYPEWMAFNTPATLAGLSLEALWKYNPKYALVHYAEQVVERRPDLISEYDRLSVDVISNKLMINTKPTWIGRIKTFLGMVKRLAVLKDVEIDLKVMEYIHGTVKEEV